MKRVPSLILSLVMLWACVAYSLKCSSPAAHFFSTDKAKDVMDENGEDYSKMKDEDILTKIFSEQILSELTDSERAAVAALEPDLDWNRIAKTVAGTAGDPAQLFGFTVTLTATGDSGVTPDNGVAQASFINAKEAPAVPQTGDNSNLDLWIALLIISVLGVGLCAYVPRRRNK